VKGYTKSLYRKLGASSRREAVEQGRALGLI
jgi:LuxR family maltose regulon positive regulatory protein